MSYHYIILLYYITQRSTDMIYGDEMKIGNDMYGQDGKTALWNVIDREKWKDLTYYQMQRSVLHCPLLCELLSLLFIDLRSLENYIHDSDYNLMVWAVS